jgi:hypothetical protein
MLAVDASERMVFARMLETLKTPGDWLGFLGAVAAVFLAGYWFRKELFTPADAPKHANWENLRQFVKRPTLMTGSAPLTFLDYMHLQAAFETLHPDGTNYERDAFKRCLAGLPFQWTGFVANTIMSCIAVKATVESPSSVVCSFKTGNDQQRAMSLKKGDPITVRGTLSDAGTLNACEFVD